MKVAKKKVLLILEALERLWGYATNREYPKDKATNACAMKIISILENKQERSIEQLGLYFEWCKWLSDHMPDIYDIDFWNKDTVHIFLKSTQNITSVAFDRMQQDEFNDYFNKVQLWIATNIFHCSVEKMIYMFGE